MAGKKKVVTELEALLPKLDEEGATFLLEQARIHLHNMEVDRLRKKELAVTAGGRNKRTAKDAAPGSSGNGFRVERADDGETYHLVAGGLWKMFTADEMAAMVSIARGEGTEEESSRRLHSWLARERRDALSDFSLGNEGGPSTVQLVRALREFFRGKKKR